MTGLLVMPDAVSGLAPGSPRDAGKARLASGTSPREIRERARPTPHDAPAGEGATPCSTARTTFALRKRSAGAVGLLLPSQPDCAPTRARNPRRRPGTEIPWTIPPPPGDPK